jgi:superfamily I DNA/RNA helicase
LIKLDREQLHIVQSAGSDRTLVNAGPGTGKTETACQRISWLVDHGNVMPNQILVLSFTRTAVAEIKMRIKSQLSDSTAGDEIDIRTMDSFAWQTNHGFGATQNLGGQNFQTAIKLALDEVQANPDVQEFLKKLRHVMIDEAQDIVGDRAAYIASIIQELDPACGVTVLSDDAQAIYGFADEDFRETGESYSLPELIRDYFSDSFRELELNNIYRTDDRNLVELFTKGRALANATNSTKKFSSMKKLIEEIAHESSTRIPIGREGDLDNSASPFVLFRRRGEALLSAQNMGTKPHRTRLRGQSQPIASWIAKCFWDFNGPIVNKSEFSELYSLRVSKDEDEINTNWESLVRVAGNKNLSVSLLDLRRALSNVNPPSQLAANEIGTEGPIFATIHSAKGRESDDVFLCLYLPDDESAQLQPDEEARVLFVGATRAKKRLNVAFVSQIYAGTLSSGRAYRRSYSKQFKTNYVNVEIGARGDLSALGLVGKHVFSDPESAKLAQGWLAAQNNEVREISLQKVPLNGEWPYLLLNSSGANEGSLVIGSLSDQAQKDIFYACDMNSTPKNIKYVQMFGAQTIVVPPESSESDALHSPWSSSGFLLAPVLSSFPMVFYRKRR